MPDHYFDASPSSAEQRRDLTLTLAGREVTMTTTSGVFSADHLDHATAVLLRVLAEEEPPAGTVLDLGCGWGPIACAAAILAPPADVWAVDVNERAVALTRHNAERNGLAVRTALPDDVPADLRFDAIWSNPPIRIGKEPLHALLTTWLDRLTDDGTLTLVVGKNLGADSLHRWLLDQGRPTERLASAKGFRVLRTTHDSA